MNEHAPDAQAIAKHVGDLCSRNWWVFLVGGIAAIVFGALAILFNMVNLYHTKTARNTVMRRSPRRK